MSTSYDGPPEDIVRKGHEPRDVPALWVGFAGLGFFAAIIVSAALVALLFGIFALLDRPRTVAPLEAADLVPPPPRLEISPVEDRIAVETQAKQNLQGYAWMDRKAGTVRIPIDRAMDIVAHQGWQDRGGGR